MSGLQQRNAGPGGIHRGIAEACSRECSGRTESVHLPVLQEGHTHSRVVGGRPRKVPALRSDRDLAGILERPDADRLIRFDASAERRVNTSSGRRAE